MKPIHPFPARMAPEIALKALSDLPEGTRVLDPMSGSGTVLREAIMRGHQAQGYDLDPLAILISKVWTKPIRLTQLSDVFENLMDDVLSVKIRDIYLPWVDDDQETTDFIDFWFSKPQKGDLRKIAFFLDQYRRDGVNQNVLNALKLALSRIIITKKVGASLAWDIPHSRPHRVKSNNDYGVLPGYRNSVEKLIKQLIFEGNKIGNAKVILGDARNLRRVKDGSIDAVVTSPPYLNAIDYLRGHKFSLIWFGYSIPEIRKIRSSSIGVERRCNLASENNVILKLRKKLIKESDLPSRHIKMIDRYIGDAIGVMSEVSRVLAKNGKAVLVVGNSCLRGVYIKNSEVFKHAGKIFGLDLVRSSKREIPTHTRYLPIPKGKKESLGKRMRCEMVQIFTH